MSTEFEEIPRELVHEKASLLGLPSELRNQIYEYLLCDPEEETGPTIIIKRHPPKDPTNWTEPPLLLTNKQLRHETSTLYYTSNNFLLHLGTPEIQHLCSWLLIRHKQSSFPNPFKSRRFYIPRAGWRELPYFIHFAHLFHETDIELCPPPPDWKNLFEGKSFERGSHHHIANSLIEVMELGRSARREGLKREEVDEEFRLWMKARLTGWENRKMRKIVRLGPRDVRTWRAGDEKVRSLRKFRGFLYRQRACSSILYRYLVLNEASNQPHSHPPSLHPNLPPPLPLQHRLHLHHYTTPPHHPTHHPNPQG